MARRPTPSLAVKRDDLMDMGLGRLRVEAHQHRVFRELEIHHATLLEDQVDARGGWGCSGDRANAHISSVAKASKDLRHNPSAARLPMRAVLRTQTQAHIQDSASPASTPELDELGG